MKRETIENILYFIKEKDKKKLPRKWLDSIETIKSIKELENHPDGTQYRHKGNVYLPDEKTLTKLPDNLHVDSYLDLDNSGIINIPNNLYVEGDLYIYNTPLAKKYSSDQIREMITSKGGTVIGKIHR